MNFMIALFLVGFLPGPSTRAQNDWPQWRGPERTGSVSAKARTEAWPEKLVEEWKHEVGGGYSGPVVVGDRLWVHARQGEREVVSCLGLEDGVELWSAGYEAAFKQDPSARDHGKGPYSTPVVAEGRLFTFGVTAILSAWKADSGELVWRKDDGAEFDPGYPFFGASGSPLVWNELCFVHFGSSDGQIPDKPGRGAMVALRVADGSEAWRWGADAPSIGASPVLQEIDGRSQLVFKSQQNIIGLDPLTGAELWRIPFEVEEDNTIVTPLFIGNRLLTSDHAKGFRAWSIEADGESWNARHLWRSRESLFMSSPVVVGDLVVGFSEQRRGRLFGLDPNDGTVLWHGEPSWGEHAILIAWGHEVLVFREDGSLVVGKTTRERFQVLRTYSLGSPTMWAHPAVVDGRILFKDGSRVVSYGLSES